jgi:hypothetical protein
MGQDWLTNLTMLQTVAQPATILTFDRRALTARDHCRSHGTVHFGVKQVGTFLVRTMILPVGAAPAHVMTNQWMGDDSWCDDIPCVAVDGDLCQWDYLTRTYDCPSFLAEAALPDQHESAPDHQRHSMGIVGADTSASHESVRGHFDDSPLPNKRRKVMETLDPIQDMSAAEPLLHLFQPSSVPMDGPMNPSIAFQSNREDANHGNIDRTESRVPHAQQFPLRSSFSASSTSNGASARRMPTTNGATTAEESNGNHGAMNFVFTPRFSEMLPSHCVPHHHHVVQVGSVDSTRVLMSTDAITKSHVLPVMCPPLTAYNYYYRNERDTIVQGMTHADDPLPPSDWNFTEQKKLELLHQHWYVVWI